MYYWLYTHWPILGWNVSKSLLQRVNFFEKYAIVAMESDNVTFYQCKIIKVTSGFNFKKTNFFARWRQRPQNSWNIFQIQITPLFRHPQGSQGCLEKWNYPLSLNLVVWCAKIGLKTKKLQKTCQNTIIFDNSFVNSEVFQTFLVLGSILAHQTTKFNSVDDLAFLDTPGNPGGV